MRMMKEHDEARRCFPLAMEDAVMLSPRDFPGGDVKIQNDAISRDNGHVMASRMPTEGLIHTP